MKKLFIATVLIAIGASCAAWHYYSLYRNSTALHPSGLSGHTSLITVPIVDTFTDAAGVQHTRIQTPEAVGRRQAERIVYEYIKPIVDSAAASAGIKSAQVEVYTAIQFAAKQDSLRFLVRKVDSFKRQTYYYKDKYLTAAFRAASSDAADSSALAGAGFDFSYDADLKFIDYSKRKKILGLAIGRQQFFTDISSSDPRLRIKGVEKFTVARRSPPFGVRVQALASYNFYRQDYSAGLGVRFDAGDNFNAGINYVYNFSLQQWVPTIFTKYDLLQFGR